MRVERLLLRRADDFAGDRRVERLALARRLAELRVERLAALDRLLLAELRRVRLALLERVLRAELARVLRAELLRVLRAPPVALRAELLRVLRAAVARVLRAVVPDLRAELDRVLRAVVAAARRLRGAERALLLRRLRVVLVAITCSPCDWDVIFLTVLNYRDNPCAIRTPCVGLSTGPFRFLKSKPPCSVGDMRKNRRKTAFPGSPIPISPGTPNLQKVRKNRAFPGELSPATCTRAPCFG